MSNIAVNRLTNANIYVDGQSFLGRAEEVNLPDIKHMLSEHKALGMMGKVELWSGIDKLEAKIKWNSFYSDVFKKFANPFKTLNLQVRSSLETYTSQGRSAQEPVVVYLTGMSKNMPTGNYKQHDNVELESNLTVTYVKLVIGGETVMEVDVLANIFKVDGQDIQAQYRANLGI
jgi:P2 family phage contractile tail tube protein